MPGGGRGRWHDVRVRPTLSDAAGEAVQRVPFRAQVGAESLRPLTYDEKRMDEVACGCGRLVNEPHYCYRAQRCLKEGR